MPTVIRLAKTTEELNSVLEVRFTVIEQSGRTAGRQFHVTRRVIDHFDVYPNTLNIVAYNGTSTVATLRGVAYSPYELTLNQPFDFSESQAQLKGNCCMIDLFGVVKECRDSVALWKNMAETLIGHLGQKDYQHVFLQAPEFLMPAVRQIGFTPVGDARAAPGQPFSVVPCVLEVETFYQRWLQGVKDQEIIRFQEAFYRVVFDPGDILVTEGESGSTAYLIEEGEVEVLIRRGETLIPISAIGPGHLVGEIAMITNEPRTASLLAHTRTVCLGFDRADFLKIMYQEPHRSMDIFRIFSKRLSESNQRLAELRMKNNAGLPKS